LLILVCNAHQTQFMIEIKPYFTTQNNTTFYILLKYDFASFTQSFFFFFFFKWEDGPMQISVSLTILQF
jgi:hypothetical protein